MTKSLCEISTALVQNMTAQSALVADNQLAPRLTPLETQDIEKIDGLLKKHGAVRSKIEYGSVPVKDRDGNIVRYEYDQVGLSTDYSRADIPDRLREAILRPASRQSIVFHLTRLAAHLRDTRGPEAVAVVVSDIAREIDGVSEWAVIDVYRSLWTSGRTFYPASHVIVDAIKAKDGQLKAVFGEKENTSLLLDHKSEPQPDAELVRLENHGYTWDTMAEDEREFLIHRIKQTHPVIVRAMKIAYEIPDEIEI